MMLYIIIINLIIFNKSHSLGVIDGRENFIMNQPEETNDVALPVLNVYYEQPIKDWKYETDKESELKKFERDINETNNNMKSNALSLLQAIAKENQIISRIKYKVIKKQLAPNLINSN